MAQGRDLPGRADRHVREARREGPPVYVDGKLQTRKWRKDSDRFSTEILLVPGGRVQFLDKPNGNGTSSMNAGTVSGGRSPRLRRRWMTRTRFRSSGLPPSRTPQGRFPPDWRGTGHFSCCPPHVGQHQGWEASIPFPQGAPPEIALHKPDRTAPCRGQASHQRRRYLSQRSRHHTARRRHPSRAERRVGRLKDWGAVIGYRTIPGCHGAARACPMKSTRRSSTGFWC